MTMRGGYEFGQMNDWVRKVISVQLDSLGSWDTEPPAAFVTGRQCLEITAQANQWVSTILGDKDPSIYPEYTRNSYRRAVDRWNEFAIYSVLLTSADDNFLDEDFTMKFWDELLRIALTLDGLYPRGDRANAPDAKTQYDIVIESGKEAIIEAPATIGNALGTIVGKTGEFGATLTKSFLGGLASGLGPVIVIGLIVIGGTFLLVKYGD